MYGNRYCDHFAGYTGIELSCTSETNVISIIPQFKKKFPKLTYSSHYIWRTQHLHLSIYFIPPFIRIPFISLTLVY